MKKTSFILSIAMLAFCLSSFQSPNSREQHSTLVSGAHSVGELFGGGIIFEITTGSDGVQHGLIAGLADVSDGAEWSNNTRLLTGASNASDGKVNMATIKQAGGTASQAAGLCDVYVQGDFSDWYLPASEELTKLFKASGDLNKILSNTKDAAPMEGFYWSSTEKMNGSAWGVDFGTGTSTGSNKLRNAKVRAIRAF